MAKGLNLQTIKAKNRASLLYLLNERGSLSRKQIASLLGLTQAAVSKITANLLLEGSIVEKESVGTGVGRKEVLLALKNPDSKAFGVSFEKDIITFSISSLEGELLEKKAIPFTSSFEQVKKQVQAYYLEKKNAYSFLGAGISIIGREKDYGVYPGVDIQKEMESILDIPVVVRNNVRSFATATILSRETAEEKNVLLFKWGPGIGSSFIRDGKVLSGDDQGIAEIGHTIVSPNGKKCRCGRRGCLETEASLDVILSEIQAKDPSLTLDTMLLSQNQEILDLLKEKIAMVCLALMNASTLLNAKKILLFGTIFQIPGFFSLFKEEWSKMTEGLEERTLDLSNLNDKLSFIGSYAMVKRKLFFEKGL